MKMWYFIKTPLGTSGFAYTAGQRSGSHAEHQPLELDLAQGHFSRVGGCQRYSHFGQMALCAATGSSHCPTITAYKEEQLDGRDVRMAHSPCKIFSGWCSVQQLDCWDWDSAPRGSSFPLLPFLWRNAVMLKHCRQGECVWLLTQIWWTHTHRYVSTHKQHVHCSVDYCNLSQSKQWPAPLFVSLHFVCSFTQTLIDGVDGQACVTAAFPGHVADRITWNIRSYLTLPTPTAPTSPATNVHSSYRIFGGW